MNRDCIVAILQTLGVFNLNVICNYPHINFFSRNQSYHFRLDINSSGYDSKNIY